MLWPSVSAKLARHSLAQAITVIKAKLGREHVLALRNAVSLAAGAVDVDALRMDGQASRVTGPFLDGFEIPGARGFDQWKDELTAKLLPRIRDCLVRQMDAGRRLGDFASVEHHANVLLQFDALSEDGVRGVMEARAWAGDRTTALKAYDTYVAQLADVLGARPSPELVRMAGLLREGRAAVRSARAVSEPSGRRERRMEAERIVGRAREFSQLYDTWLDVRKGLPRVVVVTGDPGIGKTTLTNTFLSSCQLEGAIVARVQAYDAERELPFAVLSELVRQLVLQRTIGGTEPDALAELSRICPEVGVAFPGVPKPPDWSGDVIPLRLAGALLKSVIAAAEESPVVLVVDDIHAADNSSAAILHVLSRKITSGRFMLMLAGRPMEPRVAGASALVRDSSILGMTTVDLDPLPDEQARELVLRLARTGNPPVDRILRAGRGNALALELLTREWTDHGPDSLLRDLEAINTTPAPRIGMPPAVRSVFERETHRLDPSVRSVLDFAAVLGRRLHEVEMYAAAGVNPMTASIALARLMDQGFLRDVQGVTEFRNELIRAQAYYAIPSAGREHLHRAAGEALAGIPATERVGAELEIAWHFIRGRSPCRALEFALDGSERCIERGAPKEAEEILRAFVGERTCGPRVQLLLAQALLDQSKGEEATPFLDALRTMEITPLDRARVAAMSASAEYMLPRETGTKHAAAAEEALEAAREAGDPALVAKAVSVLTRTYGETGNEVGLLKIRSMMQDWLDDSDYASLPLVHYTMGYCEFMSGSAWEAVACVNRALQLCDTSKRLVDSIPLLNGLAGAYYHTGDCERARTSYDQALRLARQAGDDSWACVVATNLSGILVQQGRIAEAVAYGEEAVLLSKRALRQPRAAMAYTNLADSYVLAGREEDAKRCLMEAEKLVEGQSNWEPRVVLLSESACAWLALGDHSRTLTKIAELEEALGSATFGPNLGVCVKLRAFRNVFAVGHPEAALSHTLAGRECFRSRSLIHYIDANATVAWLERLRGREVGQETKEGIALLDQLRLPGRKALLRLQGFIT